MRDAAEFAQTTLVTCSREESVKSAVAQNECQEIAAGCAVPSAVARKVSGQRISTGSSSLRHLSSAPATVFIFFQRKFTARKNKVTKAIVWSR